MAIVRYFVLVSACLLLLGGCSSSPESTPVPDNPTSPDRILIIYQRSGGFAGFRDQLTIYADGHCELQRKNVEKELTIQLSQVEHLKVLMEEANLPGLSEERTPTNIGADYFEYVISYQARDGKMHSVRAVSGAVPDALQPLLKELDQIISSNS